MKPPVLAVVAAMTFAGYWFGTTKSHDELSVMGQRLSIANDRGTFLNEQITAYKDRLQGATPDEAAKKIALLSSDLDRANRRLDILLPNDIRKLTQEQKSFIKEHKEDFTRLADQIMIYSWSEGDSTFYAASIIEELKANGIKANGPIVVPCSPTQHGVMVGLKDVDNPSQAASEFIALLKKMSLVNGTTPWQMPLYLTKPDFDLFICG